MKFLTICFFLSLLGLHIFPNILEALSFGLTLGIAIHIILRANESFMFREWILLLYAVNYLLSPAITYQLASDRVTYSMRIPSAYYFSLAFPGFLLFALGLFLIPTKIFSPNVSKISKATLLNEQFLIGVALFGFIMSLMQGFFISSFDFFIYLVSLLRFIGIFSLFGSNPRKYRYFMLLAFGFEIYSGAKSAMFHDAIMWVIFLAIYSLYMVKPNIVVKIMGAGILILFVLLIQLFKAEFRERVWQGDEASSFETITDVGIGVANSEDLSSESSLLGTLNRGNQAWIFASTVDNMDRTKDFQGMNLINIYLQSALLPRFLSPNKIKSGDRQIFNKFSGHQLSEGTAMGLGVFADGYVAYGRFGVYIFTFALGLLFSLTFKLVERWSNISPIYILLILPMLNYSVRPDCELQTAINHLSKSILVYGGLVYLTKYRFTMNFITLNKR